MLDILALLVPFFIVGKLGLKLPAWCVRQGMVAEITARHAHSTPTPHGGGVLIVAVVVPLMLLAVFLLPWLGVPLENRGFLVALILSSLLVAAVGYYDDKFGLSARWRLLAHLIAVGIGLVFLPQLFDAWPLWLEKVILLLAWGWFVNLYNFMDGLDGLSTSETIFLCVALAFIAPMMKPFLLILAGASLGFLRVNWMPAKVFVGDVGSTFYGYLLAGFALYIAVDDTWSLIYPLLTLPLVFTGDSTYTLIKRIAQGHKPWEPHREFWIHRMATFGFSHAQVVEFAMALNIILFVIAMLGLWLNIGIWTLIFGLGLVIFAAILFKKLEIKKKDSNA